MRISCWVIAFLAFFEHVGSAQNVDKTTLEIEIGATTLPPYMVRWFEREIADFSKKNSEVSISTTALSAPIRPFSSNIQDLPRLPDNIIGIQTLAGGEVDYLISQDLIVPLDDFIPDHDFEVGAFNENAWKSVTRNGKKWGVPILLDTKVLFYDPKAFEAAGLMAPPKTWDEFLEYIEKLTLDLNGDGATDQWGVWMPPSIGLEAFLWRALDRQHNIQYAPGGIVNFNQPQIRKNLQFIRDLMESPYTNKGAGASFGRPVGQKNSAMMIINNYIQHLPLLVNPMMTLLRDSKYKVAHLPSNADPVTGTGNRIYLAIRKSTPEKERASWEFLKWMSRPDISLHTAWFGFPARNDIRERKDVQRMLSRGVQNYDILLEAAGRAREADVQFENKSLSALRRPVDMFFSGRSDLDATIASMTKIGSELLITETKSVDTDDLL